MFPLVKEIEENTKVLEEMRVITNQANCKTFNNLWDEGEEDYEGQLFFSFYMTTGKNKNKFA